MDISNEAVQRLLSDKACKLEELRRRKPGDKGYKRTLKAFLEADAAVQQVLLAHAEARSWRATQPPGPDRSSGN